MSVTYFPFGTPSGSSSSSQQGTALLVPADGSSSVLVTYATAYPTATTRVWLQVEGAAAGIVIVQPSLLTAEGFTITATGGPPGSTVTVFWASQGN
jgi:hypothetical protein